MAKASKKPAKKTAKKAAKKTAKKVVKKAAPLKEKALVSLKESSLKTLSSYINKFKEEENLQDHHFTITVKPAAVAARGRVCPPGYHLEIDPDTLNGVCVQNR